MADIRALADAPAGHTVVWLNPEVRPRGVVGDRSVALARHLRTRLDPAGSGESLPPGFAELELLEAAVAESTVDPEARGRLAARLRTLQWKLDATRPPGDEIDLTDGTDDDIFAAIDKTLGLT